MIMNIPFLSKPAIKFYSSFPQISNQYPIYPARNYKRSWVRDCAHAFSKYKKRIGDTKTLITAAKCPGIRESMESGYIVQSWFDFTIETNSDNQYEYTVHYPNMLKDYLESINYKNPLISDFDLKFSPLKIPTGNSLKSILKIWTPYHIEIPNTHKLLIAPIHYDDNQAFTACSGIIEGFEIDFNVHVYWHTTNGTVHIPAGTPLCQLIPIKKDSSDIKIETLPINSTINDKVERRRLLKFNRFQL
jgi:hypothetical protein